MQNQIFVERIFELGDGTLSVRFEHPQRAATGEFQCVWSIAWPHEPAGGYVCGEDGLQALMLAMKHVGHLLYSSADYQEGRLTLWTQTDLDLPPLWGAGPLYQIPAARGSGAA